MPLLHSHQCGWSPPEASLWVMHAPNVWHDCILLLCQASPYVALDWMLCHGYAEGACGAKGALHAQVGAEIVRKALSYPLRLIANNAGVNGSVVQQRVLENLDQSIGYNAATDKYEDLMKAGIIDPTKVRRCQNFDT